MISGRKKYRCGRNEKALTQLLFAVYVLLSWSDDSEVGYELFSWTRATHAVVHAVVLGGALLPHGDFALDPTFFRNGTVERDVADDVAKGARRAGRWLVELQQNQAREHQKRIRHRTSNETRHGDGRVADDEPMIVLMTTPHGIKLDYDYGIYISSKGSGTATIGGDCIGFGDKLDHLRKEIVLHLRGSSNKGSNSTNNDRRDCQHKPYNVSLTNIDLAPTTMAEDLLAVLQQEKKHPISGIYSYNEEAPIPLNWGEIIPLLLLPTASVSADSFSAPLLSKNPVLPLIWTFPQRRYDHSVEMVPELLNIGADIMEWAEERPEKIAILVSGDLSHTHLSSGPYGYSAASGPYDDAIGKWAGGHDSGNGIPGGSLRSRDPCQPEATAALLHRAKELQPDAKSCGFTGHVLWHGMMCGPFSAAKSSSPQLSTTNDFPAETDNDSNRDMIEKKKRSMKFNSKVFVNRNVTYYGMIGAIFERTILSGDDGNDNGGIGFA